MGVKLYDSSGRLKTLSETAIAVDLLNHPGYRTDQTTNGFYVGYNHVGTDAGIAHTHIQYQLWYFPEDVSIVRYGMSGDDSGNTGVLAVGFYNNSDGIPTTLISDTSASMTGNGTGDTEVTVNISVTKGWKWMASVVTSGTVDIEHTYVAGQSNTKNTFSQPVSGYNADWGVYSESGSALPTTATPSTSANKGYVARIGVRFSK